MSSSISFIAVSLFITFAAPSSADMFLKGHHHEGPMGRMTQEEVQSTLLAEVEGTFGAGSATSRLQDLEALLKPMFVALPKNEHGGLGHATVRYALHRLFIQRHGWSIKGIDAAGDSWNSSSAADILKDQVPAYIQDLFEQHLGGRGFGLHELSVLAATIEHLIHSEASQRLSQAIKLRGLLVTDLMTGEQADLVLDTYMVAYILGEDLSNMTLEEADETIDEMPEIYGAWPETREFVHGKRARLFDSENLSFKQLVQVAEKVGEEFGKLQDRECQQIKARLVASEEKGETGRLTLSDFYRPSADGEYMFREKVEYLRDLGVLDESVPKRPRVMLANYIGSPSNCIASSSFYEVCCMNECESLLTHVEQHVAASEATPEDLLALVSALPSSTVQAPRTLSETLKIQLHNISNQHAGAVPLHGRLFAQWMHHAYPRECPYPHVVGTIKPQNPDDWDESMGGDCEISDEEIMNHTFAISPDEADVVSVQDNEEQDVSLPWSPEEELLVVRPQGKPKASTSNTRLSLLLWAVAFSASAAVVRTLFKPTQHQACAVHMEKIYV